MKSHFRIIIGTLTGLGAGGVFGFLEHDSGLAVQYAFAAVVTAAIASITTRPPWGTLAGMALGLLLGAICRNQISFLQQIFVCGLAGTVAGGRANKLDPAAPPATRREWTPAWLASGALTALAALAVLVRLPLLANIDAIFDSDAAVNALSVKHVVTRGEPLLFPYGQRYQGLTEGLAALPWVAVWGWRPISFALSPLMAWILIQGLFCCWIARAWGRSWAVAWMATQIFVPAESLWISLQPLGGHLWVSFLGLLSLYVGADWTSRPSLSSGRWLGMACLQLLGHYTYSYFQVFVPVLTLQFLTLGKRSIRVRIAQIVTILVLPMAMVEGVRAFSERVQGDRSYYPRYWKPGESLALADLGSRWNVLTRQVLPLAMSVPGGVPDDILQGAARSLRAVEWVATLPALRFAGNALWTIQWLAVLAVCMGATAAPLGSKPDRGDPMEPGDTQRPTEPHGPSTWPLWVMVQLIVCTGAFVGFRFANYWECVRHLTLLQPAAVFAVLAASRTLWRLSPSRDTVRWACRGLAAGLLACHFAYYTIIDIAYFRTSGMVDNRFRVQSIDSPSTLLARWLTERGYEGMVGFADYWLAFPTSLITEERIRLAPSSLSRVPVYALEASVLADPLWITLERYERDAPPSSNGRALEAIAVLHHPEARVVIWQTRAGDLEGSPHGATGQQRPAP